LVFSDVTLARPKAWAFECETPLAMLDERGPDDATLCNPLSPPLLVIPRTQLKFRPKRRLAKVPNMVPSVRCGNGKAVHIHSIPDEDESVAPDDIDAIGFVADGTGTVVDVIRFRCITPSGPPPQPVG
jgi:hypothetical protein